MLCHEEICKWFKELEGEARIELMCSLLDSCLPLELRFLGTYLEYSAGKHNLHRYEKAANESSFGDMFDLLDAGVRRKTCLYLALLYSYNKKAATDLFHILHDFDIGQVRSKLSGSKECKNSNADNHNTCLNEIKLLFCMASYHPAFDFHQKKELREKLIECPTKITGTVPSCTSASQHHIYSREKQTPLLENKLENVTSACLYNKSDGSHQELASDTTKPLPVETSGLRRSTKVTHGLSELALKAEDETNVPHSNVSTTIPRGISAPDLRAPLVTDPYRYPSLPLSAVFHKPHTVTGVTHSATNIQGLPLANGIAGQITVLPPSPNPQNVANVQGLLVQSGSIVKHGGLTSGTNGIIQPVYPTALYANTVPSISSSPHYPSNLGESQLRSSSAPIPVRPQRMYHPLNKGNVNVIHAVPGAFNFGVSPYQSPLDSPLPSPISSPFTSPSMSPQVSPRPSPAQSPMFRRKSTGSMSGRKEHYQYATVFDWLKSLRLHKYNDIFKDYSFEQMARLTDEDLINLGLTQGACKKFRLHIDALVERGFKGFGLHIGSPIDKFVFSPSPSDVMQFQGIATGIGHNRISSIGIPHSQISPGSIGTINKHTMSQSSDSCSHLQTVQEQTNLDQNANRLSGQAQQPVRTINSIQSEKDRQQSLRTENVELLNSNEKSSDEGSQETEESLDDDYLSDDEVFLTRRRTVIERKPNRPSPSCYNCGSKTHFGDECIEQTMEGQTYRRYSYKLRYSSEQPPEVKR